VIRCLAVFLGALCLQAQTTLEPLVFRTTTRLVQVNVVVHDRKGSPVSDLKKQEFSLSEEGAPQQIAFFQVQSANQLVARPAKLGKNMFSNMLEQRDGVPASVSVILLDLLNTSWSDIYQARAAIIKYLRQIQPGDRIALYTLSRGIRVLHDYTTDAASLLSKIHSYNGEVMTELASSEVHPDEMKVMQDLGLDKLLQVRQREADFYTSDRIVNTLKSLEVIAHHLASLPGRKNLIWVSGGFPLSIGMDEIPDIGKVRDRRSFWTEASIALRALNNAGISVYPVDARGLITHQEVDASLEGRSLPGALASKITPTVPHLDTMMLLADRTGGRAAFNTNDIENSIRRAIDDARVSYTIGYYSTYDKQDGRFRNIRIKIDRPGLEARYRKGYFAFRPAQATDTDRKEELRTAFWSPVDATAVRVNARVDLVDKPEPNTVHVFVQVDPSSIVLTKRGDRWEGKFDLMIAQKDISGKMLGRNIMNTVELALDEKRYSEASQRGLIYQIHFVRETAANNLRIIVRDLASGAIGTLTVPFSQVPIMQVSDSPLR
jgi:VWFA-related protein